MRLTKRIGDTSPQKNNKLADQATLIMWVLIAMSGVCFISVLFNVLNKGVLN